MLPIQSTSSLSPIELARFIKDSGGRLPLLEVNPIPAKLPPLKAGEELAARVVDTLPGNRFLVLVKSNLLTLNLSKGQALDAAPGAQLRLKVASLEPRLTFQLTSDVKPEQINKTLSRVSLSGASRYLSVLLNSARQADTPDAAGRTGPNVKNGGVSIFDFSPFRMGMTGAGAMRARPLILPESDTPPLLKETPSSAGAAKLLATSSSALSGALADGLKSLVSRSGLFYESHLTQWMQGQRTLTELVAEPQAKIELPKAMLSLFDQAQKDGADTRLSDAGPSAKMKEAINSNQLLGQIVSRQLDTFENRQFALQGFAWPGQPFEMLIKQEDVEENKEREANGESEEGRPWTTELKLDLPSLGGMAVRLSLNGHAVQVKFHALQDQSAQLIAQNQSELRGNMEAAGLFLTQLDVESEKQNGG